MKLYLVGHDYRFAAEESVISLLGSAPSETVLSDRPPLHAESESLITRIEPSKYGGTATATLRTGGKTVHGRAVYRTVESERETVRLRQHALKLAMARAVEELGTLPAWGALTGMRPTKLARRLIAENGMTGAKRVLKKRYLLSEERAVLVLRAAEQGMLAEKELGEGYMIYLGVPFCPSRCAYCSFVSESVARSGALIAPYVEKLLEEIRLKGELLRGLGRVPKAAYFGGGTPTTLSARDLSRVIDAVRSAFGLPDGAEFTVEAGRPDTVTREKLEALRDGGVTRISVNPQSMRPEVLAAAKRPHSPEDVEQAYSLAREVGDFEINCDLIAGLEADSADGFRESLSRILALEPENITIHTLARKRGSDLHRLGAEGAAARIPPQDEVARMLDAAYPALEGRGYFPYYLYRQKYMAAPLENTGWAKPGTVCLYNTLVMEEIGLTVALGAGGVTKLTGGGKIGRITNPKFAAEYIAHDFTKGLSELEGALGA